MFIKLLDIRWDTDGMDPVKDCGLPVELEIVQHGGTALNDLIESVGIFLHDRYGFRPVSFKLLLDSTCQ